MQRLLGRAPNGGKARSSWAIAQGATGLVTASQSISLQGKIVAHVAKELGIRCRVARKSELPPELAAAEAAGAELKPHPAGRKQRSQNEPAKMRKGADFRCLDCREHRPGTKAWR